ncbi:MAG: hypothetical protein P4L22_07790 [Candidatus Babeliales bacterium]|nr:hypothetical protein [Candidatus Babeliales bacterium]
MKKRTINLIKEKRIILNWLGLELEKIIRFCNKTEIPYKNPRIVPVKIDNNILKSMRCCPI